MFSTDDKIRDINKRNQVIHNFYSVLSHNDNKAALISKGVLVIEISFRGRLIEETCWSYEF
jgi:hypothetical protein